MATILILIVVVGFAMYYVGEHPEVLAGLHLPFSISGTSSGGGNVTRKLQFSFTDKYNGSALGTKTFYIYSSSGALLESLTTDGDGIKATAKTYTSHTELYVKYVNGNSKMWFNVVVPEMSTNDADSQTYNPIALEAFTMATPTTEITGALTSSGVAVTTEYNMSYGTNSSTPTFNWEVTSSGSDNTGMMESYDPIYQQAWDVYAVVTISGSGYEQIIMNGFDNSYTLGTTTYGVLHLDPNQLTKWKVGNSYQYGYQGDQVKSFGLDMTGYTLGSSGVTMKIYTYAYCDPNFAEGHGGNFGSSKVTLVTEKDVTLES